MDNSIGVNLRVTAHSNQGGRKYMEDMFCVAYQPTSDEKDLLYAYFGIFDGHGGREAALYAKTHLMDHIVSQKNFWSDDDDQVLRAIREGFISVHHAMWRELDKWPKTQSGLPSTSGTTASVAFVRRGKLYIGHVGDSGIVLGYQDPQSSFWKAKPLTRDHKPECPKEHARIQECGGKVISKSGVPRVVWNRPRIGHKGPVRRSTLIDEIPFLAVARSLGDLWSYNSEQNEFVVSPVPDTTVIDIDVNIHRCLILGSDGLWNMLSCQDAVNSVYFAEKNNERQNQISTAEGLGSSSPKNWINPSKRLVDRALDRWYSATLRADNTSVVTVVIDPPGPPKAQRPASSRHSASPVESQDREDSPVPNSPCAQMNGHPESPSRSIPKGLTRKGLKEEKGSLPRPQQSPSQEPEKKPNGPPNTRVAAKTVASANKANPTPTTESRTRRRDLPRKGATLAAGSTSRVYIRNQSKMQAIQTQKKTASGVSSRHQVQSAGTTESSDEIQIHEISSSSESKKMDGAESSDVPVASDNKQTRSKQRFSLSHSPVQHTRKRSAGSLETVEEDLRPRKVMKVSNGTDKKTTVSHRPSNQPKQGLLVRNDRMRKPGRSIHPSKAQRGEGLNQGNKRRYEMKENGRKSEKASIVQRRSTRGGASHEALLDELPSETSDNSQASNQIQSSKQKTTVSLQLSLQQIISLNGSKVTKTADRSLRPQKGTSSESTDASRTAIRPKRVTGLSENGLKQNNAVANGKNETQHVPKVLGVRQPRDKLLAAKRPFVKRLCSGKGKIQRKAQGVPVQKKAVKKGGSDKSSNKADADERKAGDRSLRSTSQSAVRVTRSMKK